MYFHVSNTFSTLVGSQKILCDYYVLWYIVWYERNEDRVHINPQILYLYCTKIIMYTELLHMSLRHIGLTILTRFIQPRLFYINLQIWSLFICDELQSCVVIAFAWFERKQILKTYKQSISIVQFAQTIISPSGICYVMKSSRFASEELHEYK